MSPLHRVALSTLALALVACDDADPAPTVEIRAAAPDTLVPADDLKDDLVITIGYADADADLGTGTAVIHDCRADGLATTLTLPTIASEEAIAAGVPITGELALQLNDVGAVTPQAAAPAACAALGVPAPALGVAIFCVELTDKAGHRGPGDCTDPIAIAP